MILALAFIALAFASGFVLREAMLQEEMRNWKVHHDPEGNPHVLYDSRVDALDRAFNKAFPGRRMP